MAELVFFRRGEEVLRFPLDASRIVLGRGEACDVVLPDPEVSRQQVALWLDGQQCTLEDLSGKGTLVSGEKQTKVVLPDGADFALGQWRAVYRARARVEHDVTDAGGQKTELAPKLAVPVLPAQLRVRQGHREKVHKLQSDTFTVGKDSDNDLVLTDKFISGRHLKVTRHEAGFVVSDPQSTNGTWLGNARIYEAEVPLFTTLRVGESELVLEPRVGDVPTGIYQGIIGIDPAVRQLAEMIERVAPSSAAVAIFGETGTGKELVARAVHNRSGRKEAPFVPLDCTSISKELIESELFGHEKGAFTGAVSTRKGAFETADGGTLFLDEVGELSMDLQAKLLRVLESGEIRRVGASKPLDVDVRIVAATNRDLLAATQQGAFREDLYYRLCVVPLHVPPLRSRLGDVAALAEHFVKLFAPAGQSVRMTPAALERLRGHAWPGNIRELRSVVHRALLFKNGPMIDAVDVTFEFWPGGNKAIGVPDFPPGTTLAQMLEVMERQIVERALARFKENRERVAKELGLARSTLFKRLKDWGLTNNQDE